MAHAGSSIPFFVATSERVLTPAEAALVGELCRLEYPSLNSDLGALRVVGRCGCGACPTVFFEPHRPEAKAREIASYAGVDAGGGVTGVALWETEGRFSQLEFWSVDGHDPWSAPSIATLEKL